MKVKVIKADLYEGTKKDGTPFIGTNVTVIFTDGCTGAKLFIPEELCPNVELHGVYDLYRDEKGYAILFDKIEASLNK